MDFNGLIMKKNTASAAKKSSLSTLSHVFLSNSTFLKNFISRYLSDRCDVEDVMQDVYIKASDAEKKQQITHPKAFIFTIAKNIALNEMSRKAKKMDFYIDECSSELDVLTPNELESEIEATQSVDLYCKAVANLPEKCQRVYILRKVHGMSNKDIATKLNISLSSVEKHLQNGVISCRNFMQNYNKKISSANAYSSEQNKNNLFR